MQELIKDPHFAVEICPYGSSANPEAAIWQAQHLCVSENARDSKPPKDAGAAVIRHQLKVEHWSVLDFASVTLRCFGFPHNVVSQITRHSNSHFLVQSGRYTGERFTSGYVSNEDLEKLAYLRPVSTYYDRKTGKFEYTQVDRSVDLEYMRKAINSYSCAIRIGMPHEQARSLLPYDFRQDFTISGTIKATFHWLDQRTKADSQLEIRTLAHMALEELKEWSPTLFHYYEEHRSGKARLAP